MCYLIYCIRECFDKIWIKRFKSHLLRVRPNKSDKLDLLVEIDGSMSSIVLLDSLNRVVAKSRSKLYFVHIDVSNVFNLHEEERDQRINTLMSILKSYEYELEVIKLEDSLNMTKEALQNVFQNTLSLTSKEDLLSCFKRASLIREARERNVNKIVLSGNATDLSIQLISGCAKGRGFQIPGEISFVEFLTDINITFGNPLRDFILDRDIAYYWYKRNLHFIPTFKFHNLPSEQFKSINGLTQYFITDLQSKFSHTIHTLLRSSDKLHSNLNNTERNTRCALCFGALNLDEAILASQSSFKSVDEICYSCNRLFYDCNKSETVKNFIQENINIITLNKNKA